MRQILYLFLFLIPTGLYSQKDFGLKVVKELCSKEYCGRGYVNDGHVKTAHYINKRFEEFGLSKFNNNYFQYFNIQANTFPDSVSLYVEGNKLETGIDYLISSVSGSAKGEFNLRFINRNNIIQFLEDLENNNVQFDENAYVLDDTETKDNDTLQLFRELGRFIAQKSPVFKINDSRFTWSVGKEQMPFPIVEIKSKKLPESTKKVSLNIHNVFKSNIKTQNVIAYVEGKKKNKFIIISAHYDHLGQMGNDVYFPGANDNASGVAMLLYMAKYFSENKPKYSLAFMAFGAEEVGILGSKYYVENPLFPLKDIRFVVNCDIMGTGDHGVTVVNGTVHKKEFKKLAVLNLENKYVEKVKVRGRAANSDHYWFSQRQIPAVFIYTMGGITAYHDVFDKSETLPLTEFSDLSKLLIGFINSF